MELSEFPWAEIEKRAIEAHIQSHRGSKKAAAVSLQVSLKTLYNKLKLYGWELRWDYPGSLRIERVLAILRGTRWKPLGGVWPMSKYVLEGQIVDPLLEREAYISQPFPPEILSALRRLSVETTGLDPESVQIRGTTVRVIFTTNDT